MNARISKFESLGALDGPGIRYVIFFQGCPLRCAYCHNPETWDINGGQEYTLDEVYKKIMRHKSYFGANGGVTFSGGEPLLQAEFLTALAVKLKEQGINTALDTSGCIINDSVLQLINEVDLVLLDIKMTNNEDYVKYTKCIFDRVTGFLKLLEKAGKDTIIRQVIVPTINDDDKNKTKLKEICKSYKCVKKTEFLPFKKLCIEKYDRLGIVFPFRDILEKE